MIDDGYQLTSFLRSFLLGVEEDELLEELEERRLLDLFLCFFTFLRYPHSTFSSSHSMKTRRRKRIQTDFDVFAFCMNRGVPIAS